MTDKSSGVVERYLGCLAVHDWDGLAATIADEGFVRDGPFCDIVEGKEPYIAFLRNVLGRLKGHRLDVQRISHASNGVSYVELSEGLEIEGVPTEYPECITFGQTEAGLISHISVFIKRPGATPAVDGGRAG